MEQRFDSRGSYKVAYYRLAVTPGMRHKALDFSRKIILGNDQYSRLLPQELGACRDIARQQRVEIQRTYMGKLGEMVFAQFLWEQGKQVDTSQMFAIYHGQENVDAFDFITASGKRVDVKTGFRAIHSRLLVNTEQFDRDHKDYYVAVRLYAKDIDAHDKLVDWEDIPEADVLGYAEYAYMKQHAGIRDFGEGDARWLPYRGLLGIDRLVRQF